MIRSALTYMDRKIKHLKTTKIIKNCVPISNDENHTHIFQQIGRQNNRCKMLHKVT
jgi:hypothetical protein